MDVTEIGWLGTRTERAQELANFYTHVLGLEQIEHKPGFWAFELPNGRNVEIYSAYYEGKDYFNTGPVAGFVVSDLPAAVAELRRAGIELLGTPGSTWQHFRGPDGNVYELKAADPG